MVPTSKFLLNFQEFSVGYRWHTLIPGELALVNDQNNVYKYESIPKTAFNATGFKKTGIKDVLRGMAVTSIPHFHSGKKNKVLLFIVFQERMMCIEI